MEALELNDVSFEYEPGVPILEHVDLWAEAGTWIGLVGPSGGGKTTVLNIVAGLLHPTSGQVLVNGVPLESYAARAWASRIGLLSQEPALLRGTVDENVAFFREVAVSDVDGAIRLAAIEAEVGALPDGRQTQLGEGESGVSGGQKQRLSLARALALHPDVLLLDEPTSALDAASEQAIERALLELPATPIVIVASHRPALLQRCHQLLHIEGGRVVARTKSYSVAQRWMRSERADSTAGAGR